MFFESKANGLRFFFFPFTEAREKRVNQSLSGLTEQEALSADPTAADGITSNWSLFYQQADHVKPKNKQLNPRAMQRILYHHRGDLVSIHGVEPKNIKQ